MAQTPNTFDTINNKNFDEFKNYVYRNKDVPDGKYHKTICDKLAPYDHSTYSIGGKKIIFPNKIILSSQDKLNEVFVYVIDLRYVRIQVNKKKPDVITIEKINDKNDNTVATNLGKLILSKSIKTRNWAASWYNQHEYKLEIHNMNVHYCLGCNKNLLGAKQCSFVSYFDKEGDEIEVSYCTYTFEKCLLSHSM